MVLVDDIFGQMQIKAVHTGVGFLDENENNCSIHISHVIILHSFKMIYFKLGMQYVMAVR